MGEGKIVTPYDDLTYQIIGCAMAVHRKLGPGLREDSYQRDLEIHLAEKGLSFEAQVSLEVRDSLEGDVLIGYYIPDFIVAEKIVVEIKALKGLENGHLAQVIGYLAVTGCPVGLLLNFGRRSLEYRRILPPKDVAQHRVNCQWLFVPDWMRESDGKKR
jgi:GxxExxY protein